MADRTKLLSAPVSIPTGYEGMQREIQLKRKLAESMLGQGTNYRHGSWTQVMADLANAYGGVSTERKAAELESELNARIKTDAAAARTQLMEAINGKMGPAPASTDVSGMPQALNTPMDYQRQPVEDPVAAGMQFAGHPLLKDDPMVQALSNAYTKRMENQQTFEAPTNVMVDGQLQARQFNKGGGFKDLAGAMMPVEMKEYGGQLYNPLTTPAGTKMNDPDKMGQWGPDGQPTINQPLAGFELSKAATGATRVSTSTYVDAQDKSFGKQIPEAIVADLTKSREVAQNYIKSAPALRAAGKAAKDGMFTGFAANQRLNLARFADLAGIGGKNQVEKIANSQTFLRSMGSQMFPILQALRPASDTDLLVAQRMTGGDLTLSGKEIMRAVKAAESGGREALRAHRGRVRGLAGDYSNNPQIAQGLQTFDVDDSGIPMSAQERAAEILAKRRGQR